MKYFTNFWFYNIRSILVFQILKRLKLLFILIDKHTDSKPNSDWVDWSPKIKKKKKHYIYLNIIWFLWNAFVKIVYSGLYLHFKVENDIILRICSYVGYGLIPSINTKIEIPVNNMLNNYVYAKIITK